MSIFGKIFGNANEKYLNQIKPLIGEIGNLEKELKELPDEKLKSKTSELKERLKKRDSSDDILAPAFALVREAARRTLGQRHFDVQLMGGIVLHQGKIAEMKTGEGKTLTATLSLFLNALGGKGCHLVTVNDYLARRDAVWMGQIYNLLGLSTGCLNHEQSFVYDPDFKHPEQEKEKMRDERGSFYVVEDFLRPCSRRDAYLADITYGTNNEFGFDYLRDNMVYDLKMRSQRGFNYAIVDEVDSILIDEARTPLIISSPDAESSKYYSEFARIIPKLSPDADYQIDEKIRAVTLTEEGINKIEKILGLGNIYEEKGARFVHHLEQALKAEALFKKDRDYIVKDGQIIIVDEFTGRLMPGRRWSGGLHQAVEAKEGVKIQPESLTLASITFQNYFRLYEKLAGMTGTAVTSGEEFAKVYNLEVVAVPSNKPLIRKDLPDRIYKTEEGKSKSLLEEIKNRHKAGQPLLVGTRSVEKNEYLGKLLEREGVPHEILNAKNHEREAQIIAQAGKLGAVTIATNMAGRGVDIILGGNPSDPAEKEKIIQLGGLHVIGTERHEARRIDDQLRGRTGRQGDPGSSQFFVSLEDDLMRIFGGDRISSLMTALKIPEDQPIEAGLVSKAIEDAQAKIEGLNFDLRKHVLDYDDVMSKHREAIYKRREEILSLPADKLKESILRMISNAELSLQDYEKKEKELGPENLRQVERFISLRVLDMLWIDHLENMDYLRDSVRLRAYGQRDPLVEYKSEGHKLFKKLLDNLENTIADTLIKVRAEPAPQAGPRQNTVTIGQKQPGRNDPCPCGAKHPDGRPMKYKHCHGA